MIFWSIVGAAVGLVLIMLWSTWYFNFMSSKIFGDQHKALDYIVSTGEVPIEWNKAFYGRLIKANKNGVSSEKIQIMQQKQSKRNIKKLNKLKKYAKITNLVENESVREVLITSLDMVIYDLKNGGDDSYE